MIRDGQLCSKEQARERMLPLSTVRNRSEQMEIEPNTWKSVRTDGNRSEQMEIGPNKWKSIRTNGNRSKQMEIDPNKWNSIRHRPFDFLFVIWPSAPMAFIGTWSSNQYPPCR